MGMLIANDGKIMKDHRNGRAANVLVGVTIALMALSSIVLIATGGGS